MVGEGERGPGHSGGRRLLHRRTRRGPDSPLSRRPPAPAQRRHPADPRLLQVPAGAGVQAGRGLGLPPRQAQQGRDGRAVRGARGAPRRRRHASCRPAGHVSRLLGWVGELRMAHWRAARSKHRRHASAGCRARARAGAGVPACLLACPLAASHPVERCGGGRPVTSLRLPPPRLPAFDQCAACTLHTLHTATAGPGGGGAGHGSSRLLAPQPPHPRLLAPQPLHPSRPTPPPLPCAPTPKQVLEETGLDISGGLREADFIDAQLGDQDTRLFIVQVRGWTGGGRVGRPPAAAIAAALLPTAGAAAALARCCSGGAAAAAAAANDRNACLLPPRARAA